MTIIISIFVGFFHLNCTVYLSTFKWDRAAKFEAKLDAKALPKALVITLFYILIVKKKTERLKRINILVKLHDFVFGNRKF